MASSSTKLVVLFIFSTFIFSADGRFYPRYKWPRPRPRYRSPPPRYSSNSYKYYQLNLPEGPVGPESIAFDCEDKGPYVGLSDGRIFRWQEGWAEFAVTSANRNRCDRSNDTSKEPICGRPLGLKFHPTACDLYIADAYFGVLKVGREGGVATQLATSAEGVPFKFTNDLDIDPITGAIYFTDSSTIYERRDFARVISTKDTTGRLLKYNPTSKDVTVLYKGLAFPNGVVLSKNNSHLLVVESINNQVLKFPLSNNDIGAPQVFARLDRFPDNIRRSGNGEYWVALNAEREKLQEDPVGIKFNEYGRIVEVVNGNRGNTLEFVSEVEEHGGRLWFGSPVKPYVGTIKK